MRTSWVFLMLLVFLHGSDAFTTKKRETTRRAFKTPSVSKEGETVTASSASSNSAAFAFAPYVVPYVHAVGEDDMAIGYGTALASCVVSLALGFGLGYGT
jgi:hypothetical protein